MATILQLLKRSIDTAARAKTMLSSELFYRHLAGACGRGVRIENPLLIKNLQCFSFGNNVRIRQGARLEGVIERFGEVYSPKVEIGDGTTIEQGFHLACASSIRIGSMVAITEYVAIFDIFHPYEDPETPIVSQKLRTAPVEIGNDCLIGFGAVIQPGVRIGKHCIVGANSVVTKDIPDFCVAAGAPARVIRQYSASSRTWESRKNVL